MIEAVSTYVFKACMLQGPSIFYYSKKEIPAFFKVLFKTQGIPVNIVLKQFAVHSEWRENLETVHKKQNYL